MGGCLPLGFDVFGEGLHLGQPARRTGQEVKLEVEVSDLPVERVDSQLAHVGAEGVVGRASPAALRRGEPVSRSAKQAEARVLLALYGATLIFVQCFMIGAVFIGGLNLYRQNSLNLHGTGTKGVVSYKSVRAGKYNYTYNVHFRYTVTGITYEASSEVSTSFYHTSSRGEPLAVTYLPNSPGISRADISLDRQSASENFKAAALVFVGVTALIAAMAVQLNRQYRPILTARG